jgi:hypothetical protein
MPMLTVLELLAKLMHVDAGRRDPIINHLIKAELPYFNRQIFDNCLRIMFLLSNRVVKN